jgi:glycosyltransferase involved in cell wall biosynthesis
MTVTRQDSPSFSIILPVYERHELLDVVLRALAEQTEMPLDVIVADDGSGDDVARVIEFRRSAFDIRRVWQPDEGFRKARVANLGALAARGDYLLFLDSDCVPRRGFLRAMRRCALRKRFLTTKRIMVSESFARRVVDEELLVWRWSAAEWFLRAPREVGRPGFLVPLRDRGRPWSANAADFIPPDRAYCLLGVFRDDLERVNGFEARCVRAVDGEDQDLAVRLRRSGLRCGWPGPASTVIHLWHEPAADRTGGATPFFRDTVASGRVEALVGMRELAAELAGDQLNA